MKLIQEGRERKWYLVKEWTTKVGLKARIHQCVWNDEVRAFASSLHPFFTGYVKKSDGDKVLYYDNNEIDVHGGVTFEGSLKEGDEGTPFKEPAEDGEWVGFDMAHLGDENRQDLAYAVEECEKLAKQMV